MYAVIEQGGKIRNPIKQHKFTIPFSQYEKLKTTLKRMAMYKDERGEAPLSVRYVSSDGSIGDEPVPYKKEINFRDGSIAYYDFVDIILESSDVIHAYVKYIFSKYLPYYLYLIIWIVVFPVVLPTTLKLSWRYHKYHCIRNHYNKNNCNHICNYNKLV